MELNGERTIPASVDKTWAALNDPEVLKACIAGCETLERTAEDKMTAVVALKVGPVSARFKGNIAMTNIDAPNGYTINFDGQGGVAGFGKGSADVALSPEGEATRLTYTARATVGGKMAQIGARLIDAAAGKITEDFFKAFEAHLQSAGAPPAESAAAVATVQPKPLPTPSGGSARTLWWLIGALVVLGAIYVYMK
jgi:carbon monoxide dehydrogenase subunit G